MGEPVESVVETRPWVEPPLELLLKEVPLGVVHLDRTGRPLHSNPAAAAVLEGEAAYEVEQTLIQMCARAEGSEPVEAALSLGAMGEVRLLLSRAAYVDGYIAVLERNALPRMRAEVKVMRSLLAAATDANTPAVAAHRALSTLGMALAGSYLVLYEYDAATGGLRCLAQVGVPASHGAALEPQPVDQKRSLASRVFAQGTPLHVSSLARAFFPFERTLPDGERLSALALPVNAAGQRLGVIYVCGPRSLLTEGELKLVQGLSDSLGSLILHARKDAEIHQQRESMASLLDNLPDAVLELTGDGVVSRAAGNVAAMLATTGDRLIGRPLGTLLSKDDGKSLVESLRALGPRATVSRTVNMVRADGALVPCEVSAWVTPSPQRERVVRAIFRDISQRQALEQEVARARDHAIQRDRLAMIGQLSAGVAHEINNPLSFVKSNLTLINAVVGDLAAALDAAGKDAAPLQSRLRPLMDELTEMATESMVGVDRMASIVQSLKGMVRHRPDEHALFEPAAAVSQAVLFFAGAKHCQELIDVQVPMLPAVVGEVGEFSQVVLNLLDNAYDAIGGTGRIWVRGEERDQRVLISVRDSGKGIPEHVRPRLFEPFFTTKGVGKGTGLGLHISHGIVSKFGGELTFETGPSGTSFIISLPMAESPVAPQESPHG
ncbi:MAG: PAS domain-containing protein [Myxococcaceae bacterium]|nr:PAS domain-containing protein [Myxococcaceae bacterium]